MNFSLKSYMFKKNEFIAILARKEMSANDVAKELGIDKATLSRKISGQSDFYRNEIAKLCKILDLSPEEIMQNFLLNNLLLRKSQHERRGEEIDTAKEILEKQLQLLSELSNKKGLPLSDICPLTGAICEVARQLKKLIGRRFDWLRFS